MTNHATADHEPEFFDDLIEGAEKIALFLFKKFIDGKDGIEREKALRKYRRKVYHLVETSRLPVFRLGSKICARESVLKEWTTKQEKLMSRNTHDATGSLQL